MLTNHGHELIKLRDKINDKKEDILVVLAEIVISFSAYLPKLWRNGANYWFHSDENIECSVCVDEYAYYLIKYDAVLHNKGFYLYARDFPLCSECYGEFSDELMIAYRTFVYKKMLTSELSEIGDVNSYIFELFLELYREIEL
jgi:hypothetical protein